MVRRKKFLILDKKKQRIESKRFSCIESKAALTEKSKSHRFQFIVTKWSMQSKTVIISIG